MIDKITAQQLIDKLSVLEPNTEFDIQKAYYGDGEKEIGPDMWKWIARLDRNLFESKDEKGYMHVESFDKIFIQADKYFKVVYDIISSADFANIAFATISFLPDGEYNYEVKEIIKLLPECATVEEIQKMVYDVFCFQFNGCAIAHEQDLYKKVATELYRLEIIK